MRDRLIDLIGSRTCRNNFCQPNCENCENVPLQDEEVERLADYLLANGVIVPPCKVGDKVYMLETQYAKYVKDYIVESYGIPVKTPFGHYAIIPFSKIGKTIFLTKEEAEQALNGGEG